MTDHPTLEPPPPCASARVNQQAPRAAAFADLVCADHELLHAEFDAIIAANFPGAAEHGHPCRPDTTVIATTERVSARRWPTPSDRRSGRGSAPPRRNCGLDSADLRPARVGRPRPGRPGKDVDRRPRTGGG